jgi:prophage maintenance system killer protein
MYKETYNAAMEVIEPLKMKYSAEEPLFGIEREHSFESAIANIYQSFGENDLYPSVEEKAAMLLYSIVKNHAFVSGDKRIASSLYKWFLIKNQVDTEFIKDDDLETLTLLIENSSIEEKDIALEMAKFNWIKQ